MCRGGFKMKKRNLEIEYPEIIEVETSVEHPSLQEDDLRNVNYSPGENEDLNPRIDQEI
jgi:hypothetical protein